jgi:hypothetical protein
MQGYVLNHKSKFISKKLFTTITGAKPDESEFDSVDAPLEPQTWEGSFLCGLLKSQPHIFLVAAAKQLQQMSIERKDTLTRWEHSIGSSEDCLHRLVISACPFGHIVVAGSQPLKSSTCCFHIFPNIAPCIFPRFSKIECDAVLQKNDKHH